MAYDQLERPLSRAARLDHELREADAKTIIRRAREEFGDKLAIVSSFGAESAVLLHLAAQVDPAIPVLFLDTGMQFGQTLDYRKQLASRLGLTDVRDLRPRFQDLATQDPDSNLWRRDTDACCHIRKVIPLDLALEGFEGWITGRKRFQASTRAALPAVEMDVDGKIKVNPLASWSRDRIEAEFESRGLPRHPLEADGFLSVGCMPCTDRVAPGQDIRSGRRAGLNKTECGIHMSAASRNSSPI